MQLTINGERRTCTEPATVADLVDDVAGRQRGIAVAVNGDVVPRSDWPRCALADGDAVEILTAVQGG